MMRMRHSTWQYSAVFGGSVLLAAQSSVLLYFKEKPWASAAEFCFSMATIVFGIYLVSVILLRLSGRLEFTYSDAEIASGFYQGAERHREGAGNGQDGERD
jgi:hypothetical protein